jgi:hypothetical protein
MVRFRLVLLGILLLLWVQNPVLAQPASPLGQNILIAEQGNNRIIEVTPDKQIVWVYTFDDVLPQSGPRSAFFSPDHTQVIASLPNVVVIIDYAIRKIVWQYGSWAQQDATFGLLNGPQDAHILSDGNIAIADTKACRILIVSPDKQIVKQYGKTNQCVAKPNAYYFPSAVSALPGGRFLVSESVGSRITELDGAGNELNSIKSPALNLAKAVPTSQGNILITDYQSTGATLYELDRTATILWQYGPFASGTAALNSPAYAGELPNGNIIVADEYNHRVVVIDKATKQIVWQYGLTAQPGADVGSLNRPTSIDWRQAGVPQSNAPILGTPPAQSAVNSLPSQSATRLHNDLFAAQTALVSHDTASALAQTNAALNLFQQDLAPDFAHFVPMLSAQIADDFGAAIQAVQSADATQFTVLRSKLWTEILGGSFTIVEQSLGAKDALTARNWLLLREFRTPTRLSHPSADATLALNQFLHGEQTASEALLNVRSDLLDTYQSLLNEALIDAENAMNNGFALKWVEQATLAQGYWQLLESTYTEQNDAAAARAISDKFNTLVQQAAAGNREDFKLTHTAIAALLQGFRADPLFQTRQAQYCGQLVRLLSLASADYDNGMYFGASVVDPFEIQEALGLEGAAVVHFADIKAALKATEASTLQQAIDTLTTQMSKRAPAPEVDQTIAQISTLLSKALPSACMPVTNY